MVSEIAEFFEGANVFITGATGFVGLALIEKLLRCIPKIGKIFVLIRPKKGMDIATRLSKIFEDKIFKISKNQEGKDLSFEKVIAIAGDIGEDNLGLSAEDYETLVNEVHYVFHAAATLDFEASLKTTVLINLLGTRRVTSLCNSMENLKALVHVSSAYVNANRKSAEEKIYPLPHNADWIIELVNKEDDSVLEQVTPKLLGDHPNTYTFTKALAEHEVIKLSRSAIIRPSMIVGAWKQPAPGWTNSKNGPQGFLMGAAKGVVRRLPVDTGLIYDYIPVDIVINHIILAAWHTAKFKPNETPELHCTTSTYKPFKWCMVERKVDELLHEYPLKSAVWYPCLKLLPSLFMFRISAFVFHMIPAYILDMVTRVGGGRPVLVRLHTNVNKSLERLKPFIFNEWKFDNTKTLALHSSLPTEDDKNIFGIDVKDLVWLLFFGDLTRGVRQYLNNEEMKTLPAAIRKDKILFFLNLLLQCLSITGFWSLAATLTGTSMMTAMWALPIPGLLLLFF